MCSFAQVCPCIVVPFVRVFTCMCLYDRSFAWVYFFTWTRSCELLCVIVSISTKGIHEYKYFFSSSVLMCMFFMLVYTHVCCFSHMCSSHTCVSVFVITCVCHTYVHIWVCSSHMCSCERVPHVCLFLCVNTSMLIYTSVFMCVIVFLCASVFILAPHLANKWKPQETSHIHCC